MPPKTKFSANHDFLQAISDAPLSDVSRRVYLERWKVILQHFEVDVFTILTQPKKYIQWIRSTYDSLATQKSYISAILAVFRHNQGLKTQRKAAYEQWYAAFKEIHEKIDEKYRKNEPSEKQMAGYVPYDEIVKKRDTLEKGTDERLLLAFYTYIPPLRCDFNAVRIYEDEKLPSSPEKNYINLNTKQNKAQMVLQEFKTAQKMDKYDKELPESLVEEIKESLFKNPRDYLFQDRDGKPYRASSYNKWANRILFRLFDKHLTISLIRHSYINSLDFNKLTVEEKENIAKDMTHTVGTQDRYRLIFDK